MLNPPKILQHFLLFYTIIIILLQQEVLSSSSYSSSTCDDDDHVIFSFPKFNTSNCKPGGGLLCMGAISPGEGYLNMTTVSSNSSSKSNFNSIGRVLYNKPIQIWPTSFCTSFSFKIFPHYNEIGDSGDGIAFVIAQDNSPSPNQSFGSYLGLQDPLLEGKKRYQQLAIEMDTFKNEWDLDDNHIGIDTQSVMNSLITKNLNSSHIDLKSSKLIRVKIIYDGWKKEIQIYVGYEGNLLSSFLNQSLRLSKIVPSQVYIGFTASTGLLAETNQIHDWIFSSTKLPENSVMDNKKRKIVLASVIPILGCLVLLALIGAPIIRRRMIQKRERIRRMEELERQYTAAAATPRKFTYKQLAKATKNFSKDNLLGSGGFGSVYKGEREYLAEICTIGRLRHKNILQLQGWCHENEQLLLVYDFMANKSLNEFMAGQSFLDWKTRCKILTGLASSLLYLHEECGDPVVHRDVKPSNVMLDADFSPYLGDFGLARLLKNTTGVTTILAGTVGYMAPELIYTGKATTESDVYSFGVLALEVVSGKKASNLIVGEGCLVDYAWDMHTKGSLEECVDPKLSGNFDKNQVIRILTTALACLHLDSNMRPKMRKVLAVLINSDEPLVEIPETRPRGIYVPLYGISNPFSGSNTA
ncbi:L-type lectin-domain containing receptor kinase IX.1 [Bienertia sinuspersici]